MDHSHSKLLKFPFEVRHVLIWYFQSQFTGALIVSAMLDFLTFALCVPYSETTDGKQFDTLLEMVSDRGRMLFRLFQVCRIVPTFIINI